MNYNKLKFYLITAKNLYKLCLFSFAVFLITKYNFSDIVSLIYFTVFVFIFICYVIFSKSAKNKFNTYLESKKIIYSKEVDIFQIANSLLHNSFFLINYKSKKIISEEIFLKEINKALRN